MPIKQTAFVKGLQKQYGRNWMRVYYSMRAKQPDNPAILEAEGVRGHNTLKSHQPPYLRRKKMLVWRKRQKRGAIMRPETFDRIKKKSGARVAGAAYWRTADSKFNKK
jgi:hypothetical protein